MNDFPPASPRFVRLAWIALDVATVVAGIAAAFAFSRHFASALVTITILIAITVTAFIILLREFTR
ncbi:hypothetical protein [Sphingomonas sp. BAUL-RG-20F-R05-02]|uniref:hypothetical protein n=1 Tax=Sphingomonas sp. BAUL-RG-20F-R05-02 TaxID=2914830 RepID=UPI001F58DE29|nr:hypothetical protein [Sphingomonas sp. BAUL-RG-20F-R05-02]